MTGEIITIAAAALAVTKGVDLIRNLADPDGERSPALWNAAAFVLGIGAAFGFDAAGYTITGGGPTLFATGLMIGAVASGWHEVLDVVSTAAHKRRVEAIARASEAGLGPRQAGLPG